MVQTVGEPVAVRGRTLAVWLSALAATAVVVTVVLLAGPGRGGGPGPIRTAPAPLDQGGRSLDRCALALDSTGLAGGYPARADWRPLALLSTGDVVVTLLDAPTPFACVTGPRTVAVSDPGSAVPLDTARLLLSTPDGVLVAVAPAREAVEVGPVGAEPAAPARHFLRVTGVAVTDPAGLTGTVTGPAGTRGPLAPGGLAPPALLLVDRPWQPDTPTGTVDVLQRCRAAAEPGSDAAARPWQLAHLLPHDRGGRPASLLVAISTGIVGGCSVGPDGATPLRVWRVGLGIDGPRPFLWLPRPGEPLPDLAPDLAAGSVMPSVARMAVSVDGGPRWAASLAGGTFATRIPDGVPRDPRALTVHVYDAADRVLYEGPAAD